MTGSSVVNEWIEVGRQEGRLEAQMQAVIRLLKGRFGSVPSEVITAINSIQEFSLLDELIDAVAQRDSLPEFILVLKAVTL